MWTWWRRLLTAMRTTEGSFPNGGPADAYTRPAIWADVIETARLLNAAGVQYVLVGGYALAAQGYVRMTEDIDIAVAPDAENARRWIAALSQLPDGAAGEMAGEDDPFEGDYLHAIRINDEFTVDVLPSVAGVPFAELAGHIEWLELEGECIPVLDLHGLLMTKQGVRPKDRSDAEILRAAIARLGGERQPKP
jgi:hypothetical protein